jgi:hypothetical protein
MLMRIAVFLAAFMVAGAALAQKAASPAPPTASASQAAPEKYAPQYGGYCAYGVASGYAVKTEPDAWSVRKADANWPRALQR